MWRVVLTVVAAAIDAILLLGLVGASLATGLRLEPVKLSESTHAASHAASGNSVVIAIVLINLLAVLFGARLRWPGSDRRAVARIFE